ncbi:13531_t:CDS:2 [Dentiscutata heterogama]|uniref:13531_t:CDS:1 n=1 Tax=Dentiscutata heterogama TaxID=1316150 RepID=A0ACA9MUH9_9GLOM|nr:13531_t:CDS:2 [Dentiscutata heterogama]
MSEIDSNFPEYCSDEEDLYNQEFDDEIEENSNIYNDDEKNINEDIENEDDQVNELDIEDKQFEEATIILSSQKYSTIAYAYIILLAIKKDLESDKGNNYILQDVVNNMFDKLIIYWDELEESIHISAFLDPRYKKYCFLNKTTEEIFLPIQEKLTKYQPKNLNLQSPKKISSFFQCLKENTQIDEQNDEVYKYWILSEASKILIL